MKLRTDIYDGRVLSVTITGGVVLLFILGLAIYGGAHLLAEAVRAA